MYLLWSATVLFMTCVQHAHRLSAGSCDSQPNIVELHAKDTWNLEVRWTANEKQIRKFQVYEFQIGSNESFTVVDQKNVSIEASETGAPLYTWVWTSALPLPCADHSVRVRCVSVSSLASSWSEWTTITGHHHLPSGQVRLFPMQQVLREGSSAIFCCIPADGANVTTMKMANKPYSLDPVSQHVRAIRVEGLKPNRFGLNFICQDDSGKKRTVLNYVTFPPEIPQNLTCGTSDLREVVCSWIPGRKPNLSSDGGYGAGVPCDVMHSRCTFSVVPEQSFYNISILVKNALGEERQNYAFNISDRVFPVAADVSVIAGVTDAEISWALTGNFSGLQFSCRITLESAGEQRELQFVIPEWEQRVCVRVQQLQPSCQYSVTLCCGLQGKHCGPTTAPTHFSTDPLVMLDVWRKIEGRGLNRIITVLWKTFNSGSDSNIQLFEVCVKQTDAEEKVCENATKAQVDLTVGPGVCHVSVRAVTLMGLSVPNNITIPALHLVPEVLEKRIMGNTEGFQLSWSSVASATCGYNVEWCMMGSAAQCDLQWSKVPANQTSLFLRADGFRKGCRYTFRILSCHGEGYRIHEKHVGYLEEQKPLQFPELFHSVSVSWSSVKLEWTFNEEDPAHPGFITGYMITVYSDSDQNASHSLWNVSVDRPDWKTLDMAGLGENQQYVFCLAACTRAGCGPVTILTITTHQNSESRYTRAGCGPVTILTITTHQNSYLLLAKVLILFLVLIGCFLCCWSCRKTLMEITGDVFSLQSDHMMKVLQLDGDLYEVSEKLRVLLVEDCKYCDLEIVEAPSTTAEKSQVLLNNNSKGPKGLPMLGDPPLTENRPAHRPTQLGWAGMEDAPMWGEQGGETVMSMMNLTYLPSPQFPKGPAGAAEFTRTDSINHRSQDTDPSNGGYVAAVTMVKM
ncbi:leukemia inhibitory factor receptor isoform X2 [Brachyhypopomus gauderio]|uniref:leukemia inhibitory factor receptor isoform X2 n=1 Tax=Brachyhypopomus gauderio TaxID=698409 RepID=UPI004042FE6F